MRASIRTRLTLWYTGVLAVVLLLFSVGVYALLAHQLARRLDASLHTTIEGTARLLTLERLEGESEREAIHSALTEPYFPQHAVAIFDARQHLLAEHTPPGSVPVRLLVPWPQVATFPCVFTATGDRATLQDTTRVAVHRVVVGPTQTPYIIAASQSLERVAAELSLVRHIVTVAVPLTLLLAGDRWLAAGAQEPGPGGRHGGQRPTDQRRAPCPAATDRASA